MRFAQNAAYNHDASIATDHAHEDVPRDEIVDVVLVQCMMTITAAPTTYSAQEILLCSFCTRKEARYSGTKWDCGNLQSLTKFSTKQEQRDVTRYGGIEEIPRCDGSRDLQKITTKV